LVDVAITGRCWAGLNPPDKAGALDDIRVAIMLTRAFAR
jgi:hypothetical protein